MDRESSVVLAPLYDLDGPGSNPGESPPSRLYNRYRVIPGGRADGAWRLPLTPIQHLGWRKSRSIPLLPFCAFVARYRVKSDLLRGTRWRSWLRHSVTRRKIAGSIFRSTWSFRPHYGPGIDSASNRNEEKEYLLWGKGGQHVGITTLPTSCADRREILEASTSWSPNGLSKPALTVSLFQTDLH